MTTTPSDPTRGDPDEHGTAYSRAVLVTTVIYHHKTDITGCRCGWAELGASVADHIADEYEQAVEHGLPHDWVPTTPAHASFRCVRCGSWKPALHTLPERGCVAMR